MATACNCNLLAKLTLGPYCHMCGKLHVPPAPAPEAGDAAIVRDAIAADAKWRAAARPTGGIYAWGTNAATKPFRRLEGVPIIAGTWGWASSRADSPSEVGARFKRAVPLLANFDLVAHGLVVAGGAVSACVMGHPSISRRDPAEPLTPSVGDVDMFLVGHATDKGADSAINALIAHVAAHSALEPCSCGEKNCRRNASDAPFQVSRTKNCVTLSGFRVCPDVDPDEDGIYQNSTIQVILRLYSTPAEVILSFDMGSSAMLYNGPNVWMTDMGLVAANHGANILTLDARRATYETRLAKYFGRGFDLVVPGLDIVKMNGSVRYTINLPYLTIRSAYFRPRDDAQPLRFTAESIEPRERAEAPPASDYDSVGSHEYLCGAADTAANLRAIARDDPAKREAALWARRAYAPGLDVRALQPDIDADAATAYILKMCWPTIRVEKVKYLLGDGLGTRLMVNLILGVSGMDEAMRHVAAAVDQLLDERGHLLHLPFRYMRVEEGTSLIGPFTRATVSAAEWCGDYYLPPAAAPCAVRCPQLPGH